MRGWTAPRLNRGAMLRARLAPLFMSAGLFLILLLGLGFFGYQHLSGEPIENTLAALRDEARVQLYRHSWIERLTDAETKRLYQRTCTRRCHGREVIEKNPRTAAEWELLVARMGVPDRADLDERQTELIVRHLQTHFLSNVPTVLPPATMRHVKQYLWRSDFGENDLFLDIIFVPRDQARLLRYLGVRNPPATPPRETQFIVFINTHQGRVPEWDLARMAQLTVDGGPPQAALSWAVLYRDGQQHHNQGMLVFPSIDPSRAQSLEITLRLGGLGTRVFQWRLPVPPLTE